MSTCDARASRFRLCVLVALALLAPMFALDVFGYRAAGN